MRHCTVSPRCSEVSYRLRSAIDLQANSQACVLLNAVGQVGMISEQYDSHVVPHTELPAGPAIEQCSDGSPVVAARVASPWRHCTELPKVAPGAAVGRWEQSAKHTGSDTYCASLPVQLVMMLAQ